MLSDNFPLDPPEAWFEQAPDGQPPTGKFSVVTTGPDAGRAWGLVADKRTCILNGSGECWTAPTSPTGYEDAMQGDTVTAEGGVIKTATLACNLSHVSPHASFGQAVDIMAHTGAAVARVRYVDTPNGPAAFGAVWPGVDDRTLRLIQASALSGDWRWREEYGAYDFSGAIFVNNPGFPIPDRRLVTACAECIEFRPVTMAAGLSGASVQFEHPPVVGSWEPVEDFTEETHMSVNDQGVTVSRGETHIHVHTAAATTPPGTKTPAPTTDTAPAPPADTTAPNTDSVEGRLAALEDRVATLESWVADDQLSEVDMMGAALPEPDPAV